jgi:O-antigen/teichoic acid export membrane protein
MLLWRILEYANPVIAEMMVRNEKARLLNRFKELAILSASLSILAATLFGMCNVAFVHVWTHGKIQWSALNDWLLALWLVLSTVMRTHIMLAGATKRFGFLRYVFLLEGLLFIGLNMLLIHFGGMTLMLGLSIFCTLLFTLPYGMYRTRHYFGLNWNELLDWYKPPMKLALFLVPPALLFWFFSRQLGASLSLIANCVVIGLVGTILMLRYGMSNSILQELRKRVPQHMRRHLESLTGQRELPSPPEP